MSIHCGAVRDMLQSQISPLFDCREEAGRLVIITPFELPDGDLMEFYVTQEDDQLVVTDLAETVTTLASYRFDVESTPKRKKLFEDILKGLGIHYFKGQMRLPLATDRDLVSGLLRLSQAALRTSDLLFTTRYGAGATFKDEVSEFLLERHVRCDQDYRVSGRSGQMYTVDFYVERPQPILVEALSTASSSYAEQIVNRTVRMWYDLRRLDGHFSYATVLDDSEDVWKQQHFEILSSLSELIVWSERERLAVIAGAERTGN
jgi:hypothetical protein